MSNSLMDLHPWYALQVRGGKEQNVACLLSAKGFQTFLPTFVERRAWADRTKEATVPLFRGYVFSRFDYSHHRLPILTVPGVKKIVGFRGAADIVEEAEMSSIRCLVSAHAQLHPWPKPEAGHLVRVAKGLFRGVEGVIVRHKGGQRLVVCISILARSVMLELDENWISDLETVPGPLISLSVGALSTQIGKPRSHTATRVRAEQLRLLPSMTA